MDGGTRVGSLMQRTIFDVIDGTLPGPDITFEITHKTSGERKTVTWVASIKGFILADGFIGHELKFRSNAGTGVGVVRNSVITKAELGKLKNRIEHDEG
jgi:hypothetical protein